MDRRTFLVSSVGSAIGALLLSGCGSGAEQKDGLASSPVARAPVPPDPEEVQHADVVFDGVTMTDKDGNELTPERQQALTREHKDRVWVYYYDQKWGWHWLYMAYDTGHPYNPPEFSYKPHLNFGVYYRYGDMQNDIAEKTNKRTEYDGHFFVYRRSGTIVCFRYDVSIDKKTPSNCGNKYDVCYGMPNATALAIAAVVLGVVGVSRDLAPLLVPGVMLLI